MGLLAARYASFTRRSPRKEDTQWKLRLFGSKRRLVFLLIENASTEAVAASKLEETRGHTEEPIHAI